MIDLEKLSEAQLDGRACARCGAEDTRTMVVLAIQDGNVLFRCHPECPPCPGCAGKMPDVHQQPIGDLVCTRCGRIVNPAEPYEVLA